VVTLGLFRPGTSLLHRLPAGVKLLFLVVVGAGSIFVHDPWQVAAALAAVGCLYLVAGMSPRVLWA
jgi:biotin transport system permease protein